MRRWRTAVLLLIGIGLAAWVSLRLVSKDDVGKTQKLPDGSTLQLVEVVFTSTNYTFVHQPGNRFLRRLAPILPRAIRNRFTGSTGSVGWSGFEDSTNLIAITINRSKANGWKSSVERLRLFDEQGNMYDPSWAAPSASHPGEKMQGWRAYAFPRRTRVLGLQFLSETNGRWTNVANFHIPNPLYANYPQWKPEPRPIIKGDGALAVTLKEFQSSAQIATTNLSATARTRLLLSFAENGKDSDAWRIQKLTISDATGNRWSPYLDFVRQDWNWTTNGMVEFFGALWPGEQAWKLQLEVVRTAGFQDEQLWHVSIPLPPPRVATTLTNSWQQAGVTVRLVSVASPKTDHTGSFKWFLNWWGEETNVYSLALSLGPEPHGIRLSAIAGFDQRDRAIKILEQAGQDYDTQAVFFKPAGGATEARLTLALQRSRFVEFLARPEFVDPHLTRERDDSTSTSP